VRFEIVFVTSYHVCLPFSGALEDLFYILSSAIKPAIKLFQISVVAADLI